MSDGETAAEFYRAHGLTGAARYSAQRGIPVPIYELKDPDSQKSPDPQTYQGRLHWLLGELEALLLQKHRAYGADNLKKHGEYGIRVRIDDKLARIANLTAANYKVPDGGETVEREWLDIAGYALQAVLLRRGKL